MEKTEIEKKHEMSINEWVLRPKHSKITINKSDG